jgi:hypothetical protein
MLKGKMQTVSQGLTFYKLHYHKLEIPSSGTTVQ